MVKLVQTFDVASMVIKQASKRYTGKYHQDDSLIDNLKMLCAGIDNFMMPDQIPGCNESYGVDVDVDITSQEIIIGMEFDLCELHENDPMYMIMKAANDIQITTTDNNTIRMEMRFPGVWIANE